jgi:hypothetical protein
MLCPSDHKSVPHVVVVVVVVVVVPPKRLAMNLYRKVQTMTTLHVPGK